MATANDAGLDLDEARAIIRRAVDKAADLRCSGAFVVVDQGGNVISISRMDDAPSTGVGISRAKAYIAATSREPTASFANRMRAAPVIFEAYQAILPQSTFPGPGGMPIVKNGRVVGGLSTGPGAGPYREIAGVDPGKLMVDGEPANAEDLIIAHALQIPYEDQHPGVAARHSALA